MSHEMPSFWDLKGVDQCGCNFLAISVSRRLEGRYGDTTGDRPRMWNRFKCLSKPWCYDMCMCDVFASYLFRKVPEF